MLIAKDSAGKPTREASQLEKEVAGAFKELEKSDKIGKDVKTLKFAEAKEFDTGNGQKAVVVYVPVPQLAEFRKVQKTLVDELEKKLKDKSVIILAKRAMVSAEAWSRSKKLNGVRPRSRSLKAVQTAMLDDLVFPSEIVGKRVKVKQDGSRVLKVTLSRKELHDQHKLETMANIYKQLSHKDIAFETQA